jgi:hypothetical protein
VKKTAAKGHTAKHVGTSKHAGTSKHSPAAQKKTATTKAHHVTTKAKHATHAKARGLAAGDWLPVCSFEALAMSLRLAGARVHEDDVGQLWTEAGTREVSIAEALDAAAQFGLAGCVPALNEQIVADFGDDLAVLQLGQRVGEHLFRRDAAQLEPLAGLVADRPLGHGLILGLELPGPHAVLATAHGWWSWGELHDPAEWPDAVIEEAWAVSWS